MPGGIGVATAWNRPANGLPTANRHARNGAPGPPWGRRDGTTFEGGKPSTPGGTTGPQGSAARPGRMAAGPTAPDVRTVLEGA